MPGLTFNPESSSSDEPPAEDPQLSEGELVLIDKLATEKHSQYFGESVDEGDVFKVLGTEQIGGLRFVIEPVSSDCHYDQRVAEDVADDLLRPIGTTGQAGAENDERTLAERAQDASDEVAASIADAIDAEVERFEDETGFDMLSVSAELDEDEVSVGVDFTLS